MTFACAGAGVGGFGSERDRRVLKSGGERLRDSNCSIGC